MRSMLISLTLPRPREGAHLTEEEPGFPEARLPRREAALGSAPGSYQAGPLYSGHIDEG